MAQIDMTKLNEKVNNSAEIEKSDDAKQAETNKETEELIDDTSKNAEDNSETDAEAEDKANETELEGKVVVTYISGGIWKDVEGKYWASSKKSDNILSERQYTAEEYDSREDIKFMVNYGAMKAIHVKQVK